MSENTNENEQKRRGPKPIYDEPRQRLSLSVATSTADRAREYAESHGLTISAAGDQLLLAGLQQTQPSLRLQQHADATGATATEITDAAIREYLDRRSG